MCEDLATACRENASSLSATSDSDISNLKEAFTILQVEVNKSALNLPASSEGSSSSRQSTHVGEIELKVCQDVDDLHSRKYEGDEGDHWPCRSESICKDLFGSSEQSDSQDFEHVEEEPSLEYTLAMIKPDAMIYRKEIEKLMWEEGFNICQTRWLQLTPEQVSDFYSDNYGQDFFAQLVSCMSSAPILVYVISKTNGIEDWKKLMGPENIADAQIYAPDSIRGKYGRVDNEMGMLVHGSADKSSAEKEIKYFFPDRKIEAMPREKTALQYLWRVVNEALIEALIKCCEEKPEDPILWLGNWLLHHKTNSPKYLCTHD